MWISAWSINDNTKCVLYLYKAESHQRCLPGTTFFLVVLSRCFHAINQYPAIPSRFRSHSTWQFQQSLNNSLQLQSAAINWRWIIEGPCHCGQGQGEAVCSGGGELEVRVKGWRKRRRRWEGQPFHSTDETGPGSIRLMGRWRFVIPPPAPRSDGSKDAFSGSCLVIKTSPIDFGCLLFATEAPTGARVIVSERDSAQLLPRSTYWSPSPEQCTRGILPNCPCHHLTSESRRLSRVIIARFAIYAAQVESTVKICTIQQSLLANPSVLTQDLH